MSFLIRAYAPSDLPILQTIRAAAFAPVFASFRAIVGSEIAALGLSAAEQEQADLLDAIARPDSGHTIAIAQPATPSLASSRGNPTSRLASARSRLTPSIRITPVKASARRSTSMPSPR